ncbi:MAG: hypothetical protein FalmKO_36020 [Falsiruegeria mediterranea]
MDGVKGQGANSRGLGPMFRVRSAQRSKIHEKLSFGISDKFGAQYHPSSKDQAEPGETLLCNFRSAPQVPETKGGVFSIMFG